jgi:hypothetical protein
MPTLIIYDDLKHKKAIIKFQEKKSSTTFPNIIALKAL